MAKLDNIVFEDARLVFRNFAGREAPFNPAGDRNFCLLLDPLKAESMKLEGWNVKQLRPKEEGDTPQDYLPVAVNFEGARPPQITLITNGGTKRADLSVDMVAMLDFADVSNWDIILNPYEWTVNDNKGIKAYLKKAFVTLDEDALDRKYAGLEDASNPTIPLSSIANEEMSDA